MRVVQVTVALLFHCTHLCGTQRSREKFDKLAYKHKNLSKDVQTKTKQRDTR